MVKILVSWVEVNEDEGCGIQLADRGEFKMKLEFKGSRIPSGSLTWHLAS